MQATVVGRPTGQHVAQERNHLRPQLGKQDAHAFRLHAFVGEVDERVGDVAATPVAVGEAFGHLAAIVERAGQVVAHGGEVIGRAGDCPRLIAEGAVFVERADQRGGHAHSLFELAPGDPDESGVVAVVGQALAVGLERVQQVAEGRVRPPLVGQPRQQGHLSAAGRRAAGRHVGGLIPAQQRRRAVQVLDFGQAGA